MRHGLTILAATISLPLCAPAVAERAVEIVNGERTGGGGSELSPYIQCAPYARAVSGIQIFGDARSWWEQAQGRYATGKQPRIGAVMTFQPHRNMVLGHVAAVSRIIDSRSVLLDHANWSPIDGRRGQVEKDVLAVDVSPANDWSEVRVWYAPSGGLGTTAWPVSGFIYADSKTGAPMQLAQASPPTPERPANEASRDPSRKFLRAFASFN